MKIRPVGAQRFHADGRTAGQAGTEISIGNLSIGSGSASQGTATSVVLIYFLLG